MATFDEVFSAAVKQLDERGLLLNVQLSKLVEGDEALSRDVRESLIVDGFAEDRYGVALARLNNPAARRSRMRNRSEATSREQEDSAEVTFAGIQDEASVDDWWLMTGGIIHGPLSFATMRLMRRRGEIVGLDLVRQGEHGAWQCPDGVAGLTDVSDVTAPELSPSTVPVPQTPYLAGRRRPQPLLDPKTGLNAAAHVSGAGRPEQAVREFQHNGEELDVAGESSLTQPKRNTTRVSMKSLSPVDSALTGGNDRSESSPREAKLPSRPASAAIFAASSRSTSAEIWHQVAGLIGALVGGRSRLGVIVATGAAVLLAVVWWRQSPSTGTIYREIWTCHRKLAELRTGRARMDDSSTVLAGEQSRILALRDILKRRASAKRPADQELLWACEYGLLPQLKHPTNSPEFERVFANHMGRAQRLIDPAKAASEDIPVQPPVDDIRSNARHTAQ